jgi:hypothetical protein
MIFSCSCPKCGQKKEYLSEEWGQLAHCLGCGEQFMLQKQNLKVFKHVAVATLAVMLGVGAVGGRSLWRNYYRAEAHRRHHEATRERMDRELMERLGINPAVVDVDDKDDP